MKKIRRLGALAGGLLLCAASQVHAGGLDGEWRGQGQAIAGDCPEFTISVRVDDRQLSGTAIQKERNYQVVGYVADNGEMHGQVSYMWWTIAELTGRMDDGRAIGTWRTFKGPSCNGRFEIDHSQPDPFAGNVAEAFD